MKLPPYPKYKSSGVEWLGEVPEHWKTPSLYIRYQVDLGKMLNETTTRGNHLHPYLRNVDVQWNHINVFDLPQMDIGPWEIARFTVAYGDLLVCEGGEVGRAALVQDDADGLGYQKALHRLRPLAAGEDPRFMFYTLYGAAQRGVFVAGGNPNTIAHLTGEKLRRYRFPAPLAFEQRAIADFLDRETAKIDTLVAKKRTLIERLMEKRTALISRTVTLGLPPDAACAAGLDPHPKLKSTGIDWLGEVPEHWDVARIGRKMVLQRGCDITKDQQQEGGVPVVSSGGVSSFHDEALVQAPGIVVGRKGTAGAVYYMAVDFWPHDTTLYVSEFFGNDVRYAYFKLLSMDLPSYDTGSANPTVNRNLVHPVIVSWPPVVEQRAIAEFLDRETGRLDTLVTKIETAIERLHEYRAALITAAVTGEIDVGGAVVPEEDAA